MSNPKEERGDNFERDWAEVTRLGESIDRAYSKLYLAEEELRVAQRKYSAAMSEIEALYP